MNMTVEVVDWSPRRNSLRPPRMRRVSACERFDGLFSGGIRQFDAPMPADGLVRSGC